jgi:hypothetical protein
MRRTVSGERPLKHAMPSWLRATRRPGAKVSPVLLKVT